MIPFWSYAAWAQGKPGHGREILLNIALFVPLGYFLAAVLDGVDVKRFGLLAAGLSLIVSVAIEGMQYVDGLGLAEWDDVFNNVLGACLGIGVYTLLVRCCRKESLPWWKLGLSVLFLLAGVVWIATEMTFGCKALAVRIFGKHRHTALS